MPVTNYYTVGNEIIGEKTTGGSRVDYLTDRLGSVTATVNQSAQVVNTYRNKPYGAQLAKTGVGADPSFRWVGSQEYRQTGRKYSDVYVQARHYSTANGEWSSRDSQNPYLSPYVYASASPVYYIDPSGREPIVLPGCPTPVGKYPGFASTVENCCDDFSDYFNGLRKRANDAPDLNSLINCLKGKNYQGSDVERVLKQVLNWLQKACSSNSGIRVCVWCVSGNPPNTPFNPPPNWPGGCGNPCGENWGYTPAPIRKPVIDPSGTGCNILGTVPGCAGLLNPSKDSPACDAAITICTGRVRSAQVCAVVLHELIHAGGLKGESGHHGEYHPDPKDPTDPKKGITDPKDDLIYAIQCCLCQAMNPKDPGACIDSCKGGTRK